MEWLTIATSWSQRSPASPEMPVQSHFPALPIDGRDMFDSQSPYVALGFNRNGRGHSRRCHPLLRYHQHGNSMKCDNSSCCQVGLRMERIIPIPVTCISYFLSTTFHNDVPSGRAGGDGWDTCRMGDCTDDAVCRRCGMDFFVEWFVIS